MILFIFALLTIFLPIPIFTEDCDNYYLFNFGIKPFCELNNGNSISCFGSLSGVRTVYIHCEKGYYQKDKISQQILECNYKNGEWSDELMNCSPKCIEPPNELKLLKDDQKSYPPWYAEIIRKIPSKDKINKIPGMILFEREIITLTKYLGNYSTYDFKYDFTQEFFIRTYTNKTLYKDYKIVDNDCMITPSEFRIYCVIEMPHDDYIIFNEYQKPVCVENLQFEPGFLDYFQNVRNKRRPNYVGSCIVPRNNDPKIEIVCFNDNPNWNYRTNRNTTNSRIVIDCEEEADFIVDRCRIGYQYKKPVEIDYLKNCNINNWFNSAPDNGCDQICGEIHKNSIDLSPRIFVGNEFDIKSAPWHVGIFADHLGDSNKFEHICGGTIIHSNIVISAAHCFYDERNERIYETFNYIVGAGKNLREYNAKEENSYYIGIKEIHVTKNYQSTDILNDIAILILKENLNYTSYIRPACIDFTRYNNYNIKNGIKGSIMGWGFNSQDHYLSNNLLQADLSTITNDECKKLVRPQLRSQIIGDKFCATNENNSTACQGDSGGGFIVKQNIGSGDRYYLIGIINVGIDRTKICSNGFLTLFTNIQFYQNFISDIISEERNQFFLK